jgi:peptidoglycan/xylan/chitin deacetylase (PgdA/CDA1 family)
MVHNQAVPVIMFHSVGANKLKWKYHFLSEDITIFENKIRYLCEKRFNFIFHDDLFYYVRDGRPLPDKALMLTFDDGFLDNWMIVYPILKKYGVKFTIYASQEFVRSQSQVRPMIDESSKSEHGESETELAGYLSWEELAEMEKSDLVDIQSHTSTHTWHFSGPHVIDFISPETIDTYQWVLWNFSPHLKPLPLFKSEWTPTKEAVLGFPVFENKRALVTRRFIESDDLKSGLVDYVEHNGASKFFQRNDCRERLKEVVSRIEKKGGLGRFETEEERHERLRYELLDNKRVLEQYLNKEIKYLCWPGGAYNEELLRLAKHYGYWATTAQESCNRFGDDPAKVHRISSGNLESVNKFPWKYTKFILQFYISRFQKKIWALGLDSAYRIYAGKGDDPNNL